MESFKDQNKDLYELKAQKRVVIRKGKKVKKFVCPDKGYDLEKPGSKKCVKVSASKQLKKEKQARKSAKKAKAKKAMASLKRKKSMKKRKMIHKKFRKEGFLTYADFITDDVNECWDTHVQRGYKMKGGKRVPNCVPRNEEETKRDYKKEYANYHSKPEQRANRSKRVLARRKLEKEGRVQKGDGKDVDHKDGNPQNNSNGNLRVMSANKNRGRDNNKWRK